VQSANGLRKPLIFHFSGPTGVGKTLMAGLVADAVYTGKRNKQDVLCGKLVLHMEAFATSNKELLRSNTANIMQEVAEQLYWCKRSVIVFEEVQQASPELLAPLLNVFDGREYQIHNQKRGTAVSTRDAIVIFVSDLSAKRLSAAMSRQKARDEIQSSAESIWAHGKLKRGVIMKNIVPFLPLGEQELVAVALIELQQLKERLPEEFGKAWIGKLTWDANIPAFIGSECSRREYCSEDGGRGVETYFEQEVVGAATDVVSKLYMSAGSSKNADNVRLFVKGDMVHARVDSVYDSDEFVATETSDL
jgi:ATP-dependent Clp protease ATP-binding subunit ClpA